MEGHTDALRGDGLARAQRALIGFEDDSLRLSHLRKRFSGSPPPYMSDESGTTTRSASPDLLSEEQRQYNQRQAQLGLEADASLPRNQFNDQIEEEMRRVWMADPRTSWIDQMPIEGPLEENAREIVKKRWTEQGIWNKRWNEMASGRWKHEEPLELESESESDTVEEPPPRSTNIFAIPQKQLQPKSRQKKSDNEKQQRRVVREREREASRPYYQFFYQVSRERNQIQDRELISEEGINITNINTVAYENVKNTWIKRRIWNTRWGILPGMSWKHEEPLQDEATNHPVPAQVSVNPLVNGNYEVVAPPQNIFGRPVMNPLENGTKPKNPCHAKSDHHRGSNITSLSQQGPPADTDSARSEAGDAERSPTGSNSPHLSFSKQVPRSTARNGKIVVCPNKVHSLTETPPKATAKVDSETTGKLQKRLGQVLLPSKRMAPYRDVQLGSTSLGPVHSSRISKTAGRKELRPQRRPNILQRVSSSGLPLPSSMDTAEALPLPSPVNLRKSPQDSKYITRSKSKQNSTNVTKSSAKPHGISKRPSAKNTRGRGKVRKE